MGNFFSARIYKNRLKLVKFDFAEVKVCGGDEGLLQRIEEMIAKVEQTIERVMNYENTSEQNRLIVENSKNQEVVRSSFEIINERVKVMKEVHTVAQEIAVLVVEICGTFQKTKGTPDKTINLKNNSSIFYKTVRLFYTSLLLDESKMSKPELLNDLTFYRRTLPYVPDAENPTFSPDEVVTVISFFVHQNPVSFVTARKLSGENSPGIIQVFGELGNSAFDVLHAENFGRNSEENLVFLKALVFSILVFDQASSDGVLGCKPPFNLRYIVRFITQNDWRLTPDPEDIKKLVLEVKFGCRSESFLNSSDRIEGMF